LRRIIVHVERHELADAQAGRIQQLEHRLVLLEERRSLLLALQQALRGFHRQRFRQRPRRLGRPDTEHRVRREAAVARKPAEIAAPCREGERKRARR